MRELAWQEFVAAETCGRVLGRSGAGAIALAPTKPPVGRKRTINEAFDVLPMRSGGARA